MPAAADGNAPLTCSPPPRKSSTSAGTTPAPVAAPVSKLAVLVPSATRVSTVTPPIAVIVFAVMVYFAPAAATKSYTCPTSAAYDGSSTRWNAYAPASRPRSRVSGLLVKNVVLASSPGANPWPGQGATVYRYSSGSRAPYSRPVVVGVSTSTLRRSSSRMVTVAAPPAR